MKNIFKAVRDAPVLVFLDCAILLLGLFGMLIKPRRREAIFAVIVENFERPFLRSWLICFALGYAVHKTVQLL